VLFLFCPISEAFPKSFPDVDVALAEIGFLL